MTLGSRLRDARKRAGLTQKQLAHRIEAKHNSVSNWENGLNMPDAATIEKICTILDVTPNYLFMASAPMHENSFDNTEIDLLQKYRKLDIAGRGAIHALLDYYGNFAVSKPAAVAGQPMEVVAPQFELVHGLVSLQSVAAGTGAYLDSDSFSPITVRKNELTRRASFYVPVSGNSMEPKFHNGDMLIVEQIDAKPGEIGIFTLDGSGYVKVRGKSELISLNPAYDPIPMNDDIICNGRVIGVLDPDWVVMES